LHLQTDFLRKSTNELCPNQQTYLRFLGRISMLQSKLNSKRTFVIVLTCLLMGCGLLKIAYNKAPELAIWWLNDYFNLTTEQKTVLNPALQKLHVWHRQTQLPAYQSMLQDTQTILGKEQISAQEVCEKIEVIKQRVRVIQIETIPIIIDTAPLLSEHQMAYFKTNLEKRTEKWKDTWWPESIEAQRKVRQEKAEDFAETVYGDLSDAQLEMLKQSITPTTVKPALSYAEIQRRNEDSLTILRALQNTKLSNEAKIQLVKTGFDRIQNSPNPTYQAYADAIMQHTCDTIATLHATTNASQKSHAIKWLQNYMMQISALQNQ
jgi:hypothetical protein